MTNTSCDPCTYENNTVEALKYCSDCEEKLCKTCADAHCKYKVFRSHHLVDITTLDSQLLQPSKSYCDIHPDFHLDFFCNQHDLVCCGACIPETHKTCKTVLPLKTASKNVKTSSLLSDTMTELNNQEKVLTELQTNRAENRLALGHDKFSILDRISKAKGELLKQLDEMEHKITSELDNYFDISQRRIKKEEEDIMTLTVSVENGKKHLEFLKSHGSNNQLFLALRQQIKRKEGLETRIGDIVFDIKELKLNYEEAEPTNMTFFGSVSQITEPCGVKHQAIKSQPAQVVQSPSNKTISELELERVILVNRDSHSIASSIHIEGIGVTSNNTMMICNSNSFNPCVLRYEDCKIYCGKQTFSTPPFDIAMIRKTEQAVVTLPDEKSAQFVDTKNYLLGYKIKLKSKCYGVTVSTDKIFLSGCNLIEILDHSGSCLQTLQWDHSWMYNICYDENCSRLIFRANENVHGRTLDGKVIYSYPIKGWDGLTVDKQGNIYVSDYDSNKVHRLSPNGEFLDIILNKDSCGTKPCQLTFNNDCTKLFVVNDRTSISVYNCK